jgi:hypothetical protein
MSMPHELWLVIMVYEAVGCKQMGIPSKGLTLPAGGCAICGRRTCAYKQASSDLLHLLLYQNQQVMLLLGSIFEGGKAGSETGTGAELEAEIEAEKPATLGASSVQ